MASAHISRSIEALDLLKLKRMSLELEEHLKPLGEVLTPAQQGFRVKYSLIMDQIYEKKYKMHYALWNLVCAEAVRVPAQRKFDSLVHQRTTEDLLFECVNKVAVLEYKLHKKRWEVIIGDFDHELSAEQLKLQEEFEAASDELERVKCQCAIGKEAAEAMIQLKKAQDDVAIWVSVCDSEL